MRLPAEYETEEHKRDTPKVKLVYLLLILLLQAICRVIRTGAATGVPQRARLGVQGTGGVVRVGQ